MPHVAVKGRVDSTECIIFGLNGGELRRVEPKLALWGHRIGQDGLQVAQAPLIVASLLSQDLGYRLVASAQGSHSSTVFTLHKPLLRYQPYAPPTQPSEATKRSSPIPSADAIKNNEIPAVGKSQISNISKTDSIAQTTASALADQARKKKEAHTATWGSQTIGTQALLSSLTKFSGPRRRNSATCGIPCNDIARYLLKKYARIHVIPSPTRGSNPAKSPSVDTPYTSYALGLMWPFHEPKPVKYHAASRVSKASNAVSSSNTPNSSNTESEAEDSRSENESVESLIRLVRSKGMPKDLKIPSPQDARMCCEHTSATPSAHQSLEEMDFERGIWFAAMVGDLKRVRMLLDKGISPNVVDGGGYTALHYAARLGYIPICAALLEAGADVNAMTRAGSSTALQRACLAGHEDTVQFLLRYGADPLLSDADGRTALHRAVEGGHLGIARILMETDSRLCNMADAMLRLPIHLAQGNKKMEELLTTCAPP